jgi:hypothetical protein
MRNQGPITEEGVAMRKGDRLPSVTLRTGSGEREFRLRPARGPRVLVAMHQADCEECIGYVKEITSARKPLEDWGADILIISREAIPANDTVLMGLGVPVLEDLKHVVAHGRLTVIIVDQWGKVYFASEPDGVHGGVTPEEVTEWVKFIAIQCPECEGPEGEWRNL